MKPQALTYWLTLANRSVLLVLSIVVTLGAILVFTTSRPAPVEPPAEALEPTILTMPDMGAPSGGPLVIRPLFWQSRTPYTAPEALAQEAIPVQQDSVLNMMKIVGVVDSGDKAVTIVQIGDRRRRILLNESVQGWELISISSDQATFRGRTGDGALEERALPLERIAVSSEADPSVRARFAPAGSEVVREGVEGTDEESSGESSESADQSPASAEPVDQVE